MFHGSIFKPFDMVKSPPPASAFEPQAPQTNTHTTFPTGSPLATSSPHQHIAGVTLGSQQYDSSSHTWCYDMRLGFIHLEQGVCSHCDNYAQHLTQSSLHWTFRNAWHQREEFFEKLTRTAFEEGRLIQCQEDMTEMKRLQMIIDDIKDAHDDVQNRYRVLLEDLERLKAQFSLTNSTSPLRTACLPHLDQLEVSQVGRTPPRSYASTVALKSSTTKVPLVRQTQPIVTRISPFLSLRDPMPTSPTSLESYSPRLNNPRLSDPLETWYRYYCTYRKSWPKGLRKTNDNKPHWPDLRAIIATTRMRPKDKGPRACPAFYDRVFSLFSVVGSYERVVKENGFTINRVVSPREFIFPSAADEQPACTIEDIAQHFANCGFGFRSVAEDFEPWAKAYRDSRPKTA